MSGLQQDVLAAKVSCQVHWPPIERPCCSCCFQVWQLVAVSSCIGCWLVCQAIHLSQTPQT